MTIFVHVHRRVIRDVNSLVILVRFTILPLWFRINPQIVTNVLDVVEKSCLRLVVYPEKNYLLGIINWK